MASDQQVTAQLVLKTLMEVKRRGSMALIQDLERVEPDLTEYLLESLTALHQKLLAVGATHKQSQRLYLEVQTLAIVCITSLRKAHFQLWQQTARDPRLKELDPSAGDDLGNSPADPPSPI